MSANGDNLDGGPCNDFRVRRMTVADTDAVMQIAASLPDAPQWVRGAYVDAVESIGMRRLALIAEDVRSEGIAGFGIVGLTPPEAELEIIATAALFQRQGVARRIFTRLTALLRGEGVTEVVLEVRPSNLPARSFYESQGFVACGCRKGYYAQPVEDAVLMRLVLK